MEGSLERIEHVLAEPGFAFLVTLEEGENRQRWAGRIADAGDQDRRERAGLEISHGLLPGVRLGVAFDTGKEQTTEAMILGAHAQIEPCGGQGSTFWSVIRKVCPVF